MDATSSTSSHYGVFRVGALQLALPLEALREVVPLDRLEAVAFPSDSVVGAVARRGLLVPVLDLARATGIATGAVEGSCVVIAACEGRLLGVLADSTEGVFACAADEISLMDGHPIQRSVLVGAFRRPDDLSVVSVMSTCAIFDLPGVPSVADRASNADRAHEVAAGSAVTRGERSDVVLVSCGGLPFGLASEAVHATTVDPEIVPSPLSAGHFEGFMEYHGTDVPVVDLAELCGFGRRGRERGRQALLLRYPDGLVALTVTRIVDVIGAAVSRSIEMPPHTLARPDLFAGALPADALPEHVAEATGALGYAFLLDPGAILADPELAGLARLNVPSQKPAAARQQPAAPGQVATERTTLLTYSLGSEVATPMAQVLEILPWSDEYAVLNRQDRAIGLIVSRGRAIPVFDLAALIDFDPGVPRRRESVLVLADGGRHVGLLVDHLMNIDHAPATKLAEALAADTRLRVSARDLGTGFPNLTVGDGENARLLPIVDFRRLAGELGGGAPAAPIPSRPSPGSAESVGLGRSAEGSRSRGAAERPDTRGAGGNGTERMSIRAPVTA